MRPPAPFVVGVPRSGTTLLRLMLDAHPELAIPEETHFLPELIRLCRRLERRNVPEARRRRRALDLITAHPRWPELGVEREALASRLAAASPLDATAAARAVFEEHAAAQGKARWGDKTPAYLTKMPRIQATLPEARFVHVIRDPRDVALSWSEVSWGHERVECARRWARRIGAGRRQARRLAAGTYLELRYEDLLAEPEGTLRRVAEAVELPWAAAMLDYHRAAEDRTAPARRELRSRYGRTVSAAERERQHALVSQPPRRERAERWRVELGDAERAEIERAAGPLLAELGYG